MGTKFLNQKKRKKVYHMQSEFKFLKKVHPFWVTESSAEQLGDFFVQLGAALQVTSIQEK